MTPRTMVRRSTPRLIVGTSMTGPDLRRRPAGAHGHTEPFHDGRVEPVSPYAQNCSASNGGAIRRGPIDRARTRVARARRLVTRGRRRQGCRAGATLTWV